MNDDDVLFEKALADVIRWEGGYNDHPNDKGGATNFGISLRFYQENIDPIATKEHIQALTKKDAEEIYYKHFWQGRRYNELPYIVSKRVFNFAVNMGHKRAVKLLQRAIMAASEQRIAVDGILGDITISRSRTTDPYCLRAAINSEAAGRYRYLAEKNPKLKVFLNGWLNRSYSL